MSKKTKKLSKGNIIAIQSAALILPVVIFFIFSKWGGEWNIESHWKILITIGALATAWYIVRKMIKNVSEEVTLITLSTIGVYYLFFWIMANFF